MKPIVLRVEEPIIHPCAAKPGDWIVVDAGAKRPICLLRDVPPNYGAILTHLVSGAVSPSGDPDEALIALRHLARAQEAPDRSPRSA